MRGNPMANFPPGGVKIKKNEKQLGCLTALAMAIVGIPAGVALAWFLYGIIGLGR
jgi:zinc transporter ZupT